MRPQQILKRGYHRIISPDGDAYLGEILEFPGCIAVGETAMECQSNLEAVALSWLQAAIGQGQAIPAPFGRGMKFVRDAIRTTLSTAGVEGEKQEGVK